MNLGQRLIHDIVFVAMSVLAVTTFIIALHLFCQLFEFFFNDGSWNDTMTNGVIITTVGSVLTTACYPVHEHYCAIS